MVGEASGHSRCDGVAGVACEGRVRPTEIVAAANQVDMRFDGGKAAVGTAGATSKGSQMSTESGVEAFDISGIDGGIQTLREIE